MSYSVSYGCLPIAWLSFRESQARNAHQKMVRATTRRREADVPQNSLPKLRGLPCANSYVSAPPQSKGEPPFPHCPSRSHWKRHPYCQRQPHCSPRFHRPSIRLLPTSLDRPLCCRWHLSLRDSLRRRQDPRLTTRPHPLYQGLLHYQALPRCHLRRHCHPRV